MKPVPPPRAARLPFASGVVLATALLVGTVAPSAFAQTGAKPATAAVPAPGSTRTVGGGSGSGPLLSREELRVCLEQEAAVRKRLEGLDGERGPLAKEKDAITAERETLNAERAEIDAVKKSIGELGERVTVFRARAQAYEARVKAFNENTSRSGASVERERSAIDQERELLEKERKDLEAERARLTGRGEQAVAAFNTKATALDARVTDWNARNTKFNETAAVIESDRETWVKSCANRRYREDDETALRRGK